MALPVFAGVVLFVFNAVPPVFAGVVSFVVNAVPPVAPGVVLSVVPSIIAPVVLLSGFADPFALPVKYVDGAPVHA